MSEQVQGVHEVGHDLVRLGLPSKGDTIHRRTCRFVRKAANPLHWAWAEGRPLSDWTGIPWLKACQVCRPDLPQHQPESVHQDNPREREGVAR